MEERYFNTQTETRSNQFDAPAPHTSLYSPRPCYLQEQQHGEVEGTGWKMKRGKEVEWQNSSLWHLKRLVWAEMEGEKKKEKSHIWESTKGLTLRPWGHNSLSLQKLLVLPLIMYNFSFLKPRHIFSFSQPTSNILSSANTSVCLESQIKHSFMHTAIKKNQVTFERYCLVSEKILNYFKRLQHPYPPWKRPLFCSCWMRIFSSLSGLGMKPISQPSFTSLPIHQSLLYFWNTERFLALLHVQSSLLSYLQSLTPYRHQNNLLWLLWYHNFGAEGDGDVRSTSYFWWTGLNQAGGGPGQPGAVGGIPAHGRGMKLDGL